MFMSYTGNRTRTGIVALSKTIIGQMREWPSVGSRPGVQFRKMDASSYIILLAFHKIVYN